MLMIICGSETVDEQIFYECFKKWAMKSIGWNSELYKQIKLLLLQQIELLLLQLKFLLLHCHKTIRYKNKVACNI